MFGIPSKKRKRYGLYSAGQLNKIVDDIVHPHFRKNEALRLLDGLIHGLIERNPAESIRKFILYNSPVVIKKIEKSLRGDKK